MEDQIQNVTGVVDGVIDFGVTYGFQILGAVVFLIIGLKLSGWAGGRTARFAQMRKLDQTLAKFFGNVVKVVLIGFVVVITLGNFGIAIAPLIALAGASAFGATLALQGPLSNYAAGLIIILTRPFVVGNTIAVSEVSGVVEDIKLPATTLVGEDGELITVPNKDIVGRVIVNSHARRVVEARICVDMNADIDRATDALREAVASVEEVNADDAPQPQVGVHGFTFGGTVLAMRVWVPSRHYFELRYAVNRAALDSLNRAGIPMLAPRGDALLDPAIFEDESEPAGSS